MSREQAFENRLTDFANKVIGLCKKIPENTISRPIISQLIRSSTSVGANYCEANNASSRNDFKNKIFICKKETQETKYWLKLLENVDGSLASEIESLWTECHEFSLIFQKIVSTLNNKR